jgi:Zn-dependent M16 (insulinase) family peptidase
MADMSAILFKGTTYEVESGGDPLDIPSLTHADLKAFHASHYHPSQAVFMTSGRLDPLAVQHVIAEQVLSRLPGKTPRMMPGLAPAWSAPKDATIRVPSPTARADEHGVQFAWLLEESADAMAYCRAHLLESGLVGDASAPLMRAMESAGYGRPSELNGFDSSYRQMLFHVGMEGLTRKQVVSARKLIWQTLEATAERGVPRTALEAALRDFRFSQREVKGGDTPHGLRKLLQALPLEMAGSDVMPALDNEATLAQLDQQVRDPAFFKTMVRDLLALPTRLAVDVEPDAAYFTKRQKLEDERLVAHQAALSKEEAERIAAEAAALLARQRQPQNNDALPRVRPEDVSPLPRPAYPLPEDEGHALGLPIASNGISYANVVYDISAFAEEDWPWLDLYSMLVPDVGVDARSFEEAAAWRQEMVPMFDVDLEAEDRFPQPDGRPALHARLIFSARNLREQHAAIAAVLSESIRSPRFDEHERIAFLIESVAENLAQEVGDSGHRYAGIAAEAPFSMRRRFDNSVDGTGALRFYRDLAQQIESEQGLRQICDRLVALHERVTRCPVHILCAGVGDDGPTLAGMIDVPGATEATGATLAEAAATAGDPPPAPANLALLAPAQVNHCFASWAVPAIGHPVAPVLSVLANVLTNQVLHQALREEGGAYGGQARYSLHSGIFTMLSYRDPRLMGTYADFARAIDWVIESPLSREHVEEAIIGVISDLDKPLSPVNEALHAWRMKQRGIDQTMRAEFRRGVLQCTEAELKAAAKDYLRGVAPSRAAFAGNAEQDLAGLAVVDLLQMVA